jgi:hypothetical protein
MANTIRVKRRASGAAGAPAVLENAELAFNEVDNVLWYGKGTGGANGTATNIIAIGGDGAYLNLSGTQTITGTKTFTGAVDLSGATVSGFTTTGGVVIGGDLTVNGTTTTINSVTVSTDDKNIELGATASPTDASADTGGIVLKGTTDKTITWLDATDAWTFSEHVDLAAGKSYYINGTAVLSATALGSGVTGSSLTSVGTLTSGIWQAGVIGTAYGGTGQSSYTNGQILIGNSATSGLSKATLTAGSNVTITNGNGTITIASTDTNTTYSAGNGLRLWDTSFTANLKENGGLVFETGGDFEEIAVDLGASSITGTLAITDGGTGATSASAARTALGVAIGTDVQAYDADLSTLSGMQTGAAAALAALQAGEIAVLDADTPQATPTLSLSDRFLARLQFEPSENAGQLHPVGLQALVDFFSNGSASGFVLDGGTY